MARIVAQGPIGELSGKLGGQVFARNRGGAYVRMNAIPTNPNTLSQQRARNAFSSSTTQFSNLTALEKASYQSLADTNFVSKKGTGPGVLSGQNVFVSMMSEVNNNNNNIDPALDLVGAGPPYTYDQAPHSVKETAPSGMISAGIVDQSGYLNNIEIDITDQTLDANGFLNNLSCTINILNPNPIGTAEITEFRAFQGGVAVPVGLALYVTKGSFVPGNTINQKPGFLFASTGILSMIDTGTGAAPLDAMVIGLERQFDPAEYKDFPIENQYVEFSLYSVSEGGQTRRLASQRTRIEA